VEKIVKILVFLINDSDKKQEKVDENCQHKNTLESYQILEIVRVLFLKPDRIDSQSIHTIILIIIRLLQLYSAIILLLLLLLFLLW
jgi:hypothetical protein